MIKTLRAAAFAAAVMAAPAVFADECGDTVRDYNAVLSRLTDAIEQFSTCIADSKGSEPFNRLRSVHSQFASVVTIYSNQCESR